MDSDRSLSSGISIPQWMKSKMNDNRLDLEQSAFSPPTNDDNFLYIRYPRKSADDERRAGGHFIGDLPDISKHTEPCRQYISGAAANPTTKQLKSNGTDDGFKGKAAACGTSIVKVAHQMVTEQRFHQQKQDQQEPRREMVNFPAGFEPAIRRGSRSLPASPLASPQSSPKSHRKLINHNKYFTGAFTDSDKPSGWILSGLLGKRETISRSVSTVTEENTPTGSMADLSILDEDFKSNKKSPTQVFKARPSELREMNFWSPTSM